MGMYFVVPSPHPPGGNRFPLNAWHTEIINVFSLSNYATVAFVAINYMHLLRVHVQYSTRRAQKNRPLLSGLSADRSSPAYNMRGPHHAPVNIDYKNYVKLTFEFENAVLFAEL
jgi:hypothetical protein